MNMKLLDVIKEEHEDDRESKLRDKVRKIYHVFKKGSSAAMKHKASIDNQVCWVEYNYEYILSDEYTLDIGHNNQLWLYPDKITIIGKKIPLTYGMIIKPIEDKFKNFKISFMGPMGDGDIAYTDPEGFRKGKFTPAEREPWEND